MDIFSEFATDEKIEQEGRWVQFNEETSFKIARAGNKHFSRLFTRLYNKNKVAIESKGESAEKASESIMIEVMAKTLLLDWKGPVKMQGKELPYTTENAAMVLAVKDFRKWVTQQADDFEAFKAVQGEDVEKN